MQGAQDTFEIRLEQPTAVLVPVPYLRYPFPSSPPQAFSPRTDPLLAVPVTNAPAIYLVTLGISRPSIVLSVEEAFPAPLGFFSLSRAAATSLASDTKDPGRSRYSVTSRLTTNAAESFSRSACLSTIEN